MFISETTSFTQETYVCAFPSLTSFSPNVNVLSDVFIVGEIEKNYKINLDLNLGDSIAENLLRFVSKLLYKDGSGDPLYAPTYLRVVICLLSINVDY
jgi:hypothetical protein